jgi:hypothetical protein
MIKYEVNLEVKLAAFNEYMEWLKPHIKELLLFKGFLKADLFFNLEEEKEIKKITIDYYIDNYENYNDYITYHAAKMRNSAMEQFQGQFTAYRRVLALDESYVLE